MVGVELLIFEKPKLKKKKKKLTSQKRCQENPEPPLLDPSPEAFTLLVGLIMQLQQGKNHCQPPHLSGWVYNCVCLYPCMRVSYLIPLYSCSFHFSRPQWSANLNLQNKGGKERGEERRRGRPNDRK